MPGRLKAVWKGLVNRYTLLNLGKDSREEFLREIEYTNHMRLVYSGIPVILTCLIFVAMDVVNIMTREPVWFFIFIHLPLLAYVTAAYILVMLIRTRSPSGIKTVHRAVNMVSISILVALEIVVTGMDQLYGSDISAYLFTIFAITSFFYLPLLRSAVFFASACVLFIAAVTLTQKDYNVLTGHYVNGAGFTFITFIFSRILFSSRLKEYLFNKTIRRNQEDLEQAYHELEKKEVLLESELKLARKMQENFLPAKVDRLGPFRFHVRYLPVAEVGGDLFDICQLADRTVRIFLADATGHGVEAGLVTMLIKSEYEKLKFVLSDPAELLAELNRGIVRTYANITLLFPAIVADIIPSKKRISYASAGHSTQYLLKTDGRVSLLASSGKIIGFGAGTQYRRRAVGYGKGEKLFLFTDGLYEEFNGREEQFGEDRVVAILKDSRGEKSAGEIADRVLRGIKDFLEREPVNDDITVIGVEL